MCTRFLWSSAGSPGAGNVLVGRSMDWFEETRTILAVRPRGARRVSAPGDAGSFEWTSTFGSVVALMYGAIAVDGVNEAGFQVSGLYLAESDYGVRDPDRPGLELAHTIQYLLDEFEHVADAATWIVESRVQIIPLEIGGKPGTGHIAIADKTGDSAIIEFVNGEAQVHHGPEYTVMANSPVYSEQLELQRRFAGLGGQDPLPGGTDSPDRFARAAFYSARLPEIADAREAAAAAFSVIRNASAPFGTADPVRPNVSTTRWRTVTDLTNGRFFYESTISPNVVWVDVYALDFSEGQERHFDPLATMAVSGNVNGQFAAA